MGFLNFLCRAVIPGRPFTRRLYFVGKGLTKPYHHTRLTSEIRKDLKMWLQFLRHPSVYCRPFFDFCTELRADCINFYTDATRNFNLGAGGVCGRSWFVVKWHKQFMEFAQPSIEYLELFAVTVGVLNWVHRFQNRRIVLFCDNISVVYMINRSTSTCKNCLHLIRIIVLAGLKNNVRIFANYVNTKANTRADMLSRQKIARFRREFGNEYETWSTAVPDELWPMHKIWIR